MSRRISALTALATVDGSERIPAVSGGNTRRVTAQQIADLAGGNGRATRAMADADQALTASQQLKRTWRTTGANTQARTLTVTLPADEADSVRRTIRNDCTGYGVVVSGGSGNEVVVPAGERLEIEVTPDGVFAVGRAPGMFYVTDFGARGDGVADDTTAINATIAAANAAAVPGGVYDPGYGTVWFPQGVYKVTAALTAVAPGVWLKGRQGFAFGQDGAVIVSYVLHDSLITLGDYDVNVAARNGVEGINFECAVDQSGTSGWLAASAAVQINVNAAARTFTRVSGSFIADGFFVGQRIKPTGFANASNNYPRVIESVTALVITVTAASAAYATSGSLHLHINETGSGDEQITAPFEVAAAACIESRSAQCTVRYCHFVYFPIGIVYDCVNGGIVENCHVGANAASGGYQAPTTDGKGIWFVHGTDRGRGNWVGDAVNDCHIRHCTGGEYRYWIDITGANNSISDCYSLVAGLTNVSAVYVRGSHNCTISKLYTEGYTGSGNAAIEIGPSNYSLTLLSCYLFARKPISIPSSVSGTVVGFIMLGSECLPSVGVPVISCWSPGAFQNFAMLGNYTTATAWADIALVYGISLNIDATYGSPLGLSVNKVEGAQAIIDGVIADNAKPLFQVKDSIGDTYYEHSAATARTSYVHHHAHSAATANKDGGAAVRSDMRKVLAAAAAANVCAHTLPDLSNVVVEARVLQYWISDQTKSTTWIIRRQFYRSGGATTAVAASVAVATEDPNTSAITPPTLTTSGNDVVVAVNSHATEDTIAMVRFELLVGVV